MAKIIPNVVPEKAMISAKVDVGIFDLLTAVRDTISHLYIAVDAESGPYHSGVDISKGPSFFDLIEIPVAGLTEWCFRPSAKRNILSMLVDDEQAKYYFVDGTEDVALSTLRQLLGRKEPPSKTTSAIICRLFAFNYDGEWLIGGDAELVRKVKEYWEEKGHKVVPIDKSHG